MSSIGSSEVANNKDTKTLEVFLNEGKQMHQMRRSILYTQRERLQLQA